MNRALAEGRERFRRFLVLRDGGARCNELAPLLSAFVDGEAAERDVVTLREHLRSCPHCRATLRAYRAAPRAAAALAPVLPPLRGSLADRLHDAYAAVATRVGGGSGASDSTLGGLAAAGGGRGAGMAALAKVLAICAGTVGGAAACVATGVIPAPLVDPPEHHSKPAAKVSHHPRHLAEELTQSGTDYEIEPTPEVESEPPPQEQEAKPRHEEESPPPEEVPVSAPPPSESGATEYVEPAPASESTSSSATADTSSASASSSAASRGTAAGEFGP